jgi:hypothetical protein
MCVGPEALAFLGASKAATASLATAASVGMGLTQAFGVASTLAQGRNQRKMGEYNAQVAASEAQAATQKAAFDEERQRQQARLFAGRQRTSITGSGGELLDAGDVLGMTAEEAEIDALAIRYGGAVGAKRSTQAGAIARAEGKQAQQQSYGQAGKSILTGARSLSLLA